MGPQVVFGFDRDGTCTLSVGPGLEMLGQRPHELEGRNLFEVYAGDPVAVEHLRRVLDGAAFTVEREFRGRVLAVLYEPTRDQAGEVVGALGVTTDITEQRRLEREALAARTRAGLLADLSKVLAEESSDPDALMRRLVRSATEPLGDVGVLWLLDAEEQLVARVLWDGTRVVSSDIPAGTGPVRLPAHRVPPDVALPGAAGGRDPSTAPVRRLAGSDAPHHLRAPLRSRGQLVGVLDVARRAGARGFDPDDLDLAAEIAERCAMALDNTLLLAARRESYEQLLKFQALAEASRDLIAISDETDRMVYANPRLQRTGLDVSGDVWRAADLAQIAPELQAEVRGGSPEEGWSGDVELELPTGTVTAHVDIVRLFHPLTGEAMGAAWIGQDVTDLRRSEEALRVAAEQREALLTRLVDAQDDERARIAADVHDDPVQALAAVDLRLGLVLGEARRQAPGLVGDLETLRASVHQATDRLRTLLFDLEPPALASGLGGALRTAAAEIFRGTGTSVDVDSSDEPDVPDAVRTVAYRIAKEAMTNARKHSSARTVSVRVSGPDDGLAVCVRDDGVGVGVGPIESSPGHRGVSSMRDRALAAGGHCSIATASGGGTEVAVWLPGRVRPSA